MSVFQKIRKSLLALAMVFLVATTAACSTSAVAPETRSNAQSSTERSVQYGELARGDSPSGQQFGDWVVQKSQGLVKDAYVRDNDKLGVVVSSQVRPNEVKPLAQSLVQGFRRSAPNRDLTVLVYAPDKQLILTAKYDHSTRQVEYSG